jgi:hypothetical protein
MNYIGSAARPEQQAPLAQEQVGAIELDLNSSKYPDLQRVLTYWETKCAGRMAPRRADIDPADLVNVLPRVMLADVLHDPLEFRYRLSGTGILDVHGRDLTWRSPRDLTPTSYGELVYGHYCDAVRRCEPLLHFITLDTSRRSISYARLLMPLSEDGNNVTMLMAVDSNEQNTHALRNYFSELVRKPIS